MKKAGINYDLEILRGFAGLFVVLAHMLDPIARKTFDAGYYHPNTFLLTAPAHWAVLIFFILSGYVIGITNKKPLEKKDIGLYLKKRFIRIYPIYIIALILGLIVNDRHYSWGTILSNFAMMQNALSEVIWSVNPAWSLNYEIIFYLLFIPLSCFRIKPILAFVLFFGIGLINAYLPFNSIISSYAFGFCFWLVGLMLSQHFVNSDKPLKLVPILIYTWGIGDMITRFSPAGIDSIILKYFPVLDKGHDYWGQRMILIDDFRMLPFAFFVIVIFAGKTFKRWKLWFALIHLYPLLNCYIYLKHWVDQDPRIKVDIGLIGIAFLLYFIEMPDRPLKEAGKKLGSLSYGIYIIHYPILYAFGLYVPQSVSPLTYILKIIVFLSVTFAFAWFLEKYMQPKIRSFFFREKQHQGQLLKA